MKGLIYIILIFLLPNYCLGQNDFLSNKLSVYGLNIGDSVTENLILKESFGQYLSDFELDIDRRVKISTICGYISEIMIFNLTHEEYKFAEKRIVNVIEQEPIDYFGESHHGLELLANEKFWNDSLRKIDYSLYTNTNKDSSMTLVVDSEWVTDSIGRVHVPNYLEEGIEIIIIED